MKNYAYYNEFDPRAAAWIKELITARLIPNGEVDERSICDVQPDDLRGFTQAHFFCGIAGWPLALRRAGWPDDKPCWTGSCPCQSFSCAGKQRGVNDPRHLWPEMFRLIRERRPVHVFGEQVEAAIRHGWLDGISDDLEAEGYAVGSVVLAASSVAAPHKRSRIYWCGATGDGLAVAEGQGWPRVESQCEAGFSERPRLGSGSADPEPRTVANAPSGDRQRGSPQINEHRFQPQGGDEHGVKGFTKQPKDCSLANPAQRGQRADGGAPGQPGHVDQRGAADAVGDRKQPRLEGHAGDGRAGHQPGREPARAARPVAAAGAVGNFWSDFRIIQTRDGKCRRIPDPQCFFQPMVDGVSEYLDALRDHGITEIEAQEIQAAMSGFPLAGKIPGRVALLKGYGNAVVVECARAFIKAYMTV